MSLILFLFLLCFNVFAGDCDVYFRSPTELTAYQAVNARLSKKYPVLKVVLEDPEVFIKDIEGRFNAQKIITPERPYGFDYSELGLPALEKMTTEIKLKISEFEKSIEELQTQTGLFAFIKAPFRSKKIADYEMASELLKDIDGEIATYLQKGSVDYQGLYEVSYFYSRAIGHFDLKTMNLRDKLMLYIDRYLQGYKQLKITEEYQLFKERKFSVFQKSSPVEGFQNASLTFEQAFFNKDKIEMMVLPTTEELGPDIFSRLVSYNIFPISMTSVPVAADGFVRPGGDFWMHDIRHSSAIFAERKDYEVMHNLTAAQVQELRAKSDLWKSELDQARKAIEDKELKYAVGFFMFNFHHDRGFPMLPSSYVDDHLNHVPFLLYYMLKISKQPTGFKNPHKTMNSAYQWLQDFWLQRLEQEKAILNKTNP